MPKAFVKTQEVGTSVTTTRPATTVVHHEPSMAVLTRQSQLSVMKQPKRSFKGVK